MQGLVTPALCNLCPLECRLLPGETGKCRVRGCKSPGVVSLLTYGHVTTAICGPIEQKPIYHYRPGMRVLSIGGAGCNMSCHYCQNFEISQTAGPNFTRMTPEDVVGLALCKGAEGVAFTYNEPVVWYEYVRDVARLARDYGLKTILKTNAFANPDYFSELCRLMDAVNVDVKGNKSFYEDVCEIDLEDDVRHWNIVHNTVAAQELCHLEISTMVVPGYLDELGGFFRDLRENGLSRETPLHLLKFIPDFRMRDIPSPSDEDLLKTANKAKESFSYVYIDFAGMDATTKCPWCEYELVVRSGLEVRVNNIEGGRCPGCGEAADIVC